MCSCLLAFRWYVRRCKGKAAVNNIQRLTVTVGENGNARSRTVGADVDGAGTHASIHDLCWITVRCVKAGISKVNEVIIQVGTVRSDIVDD